MEIGIFYPKTKENIEDVKRGKAKIGITVESMYEDFNYYLQEFNGNFGLVALQIHKDLMQATGRIEIPQEEPEEEAKE